MGAALAGLLLAGACGGADPGGGTGGGAGSSSGHVPGGPLAVTDVAVPAGAGGVVPLTVIVDGTRGSTVEVAVEVSADGGTTFHAATLMGRPASAPVAGAAGRVQVTLTWYATADLGIRAVGPAALRLTARDGTGAGAPASFSPAIDNLRAAARAVDHYLANYGPWTADDIAVGKHYQLVIAHPGHANITRAEVTDLQAGMNPMDPTDDVLVLCYVSVGEDLRTGGLSDDQVRADPRFRGDGTGPRIDPRGGPEVDGMPLDGIDPLGRPSNGGTGFASYYLDDNDVHDSANHVGNGFPDRNKIFGSLFVNAGAPAWFDVVDGMTLDGPDRLPGLREVLTATYGRGLGCDGVFLDTIDTAAPNSYTNAASSNETEFEWTAPGFGTFIHHVHAAYPDKLVLQNRGLFFFDPRKPQFRFNARGAIDFLLFESYRLNSNAWEQWNPQHYADNRYNVAPKLMAEANRPDGFRVLSLGYAEGPAGEMSTDTLIGKSTVGYDSLIEDIHVTQELAGFRHYLTDRAVGLVNDFVRTHAVLDDHTPPAWTSTYNDHNGSPPAEPTPRPGIQAASGGGGSITVSWDVALDMHRVSYALYAQPTPFDFTGDPKLSHATRTPLTPDLPSDYAMMGVGPGLYPHRATVPGFPAGQKQYLVIRAADELGNEDANTAVLTATP